jgi:hypothetical protein
MKKRLWRLSGLAIVLASLVSLLFATPVLASVAQPDSGPFIVSVDIYRHVLETDDQLVVMNYNVPYATPPAETIDETFIARYMNGATEIANDTAYAYYNGGYGFGIVTMYVSATDAPAWGGAYTMKFMGNPGLTWGGSGTPPVVSSITLSWHATTTATATSSLLGANILSWATTLSNYWSVALTTSTAGGERLSSYGETYFTNSIDNLRTICPQIFAAGSAGWEYTPTTTTALSPTTPDELIDVSGFSVWMFGSNTAEGMMKALIYVLLIGALMYWLGMKTRMDLGVGTMLFTVPIAAKLGILAIGGAVIVGFLCLFVLGFTLIIQRGAA